MKNLYLSGFLGLFIFLSKTVSAQETLPIKQNLQDKPSLFSQLPEKSACNKNNLLQLVQAGLQEEVSLNTENNFSLKGMIVDKIRRDQQTYSINIRLTNFQGALFNLSFIVKNQEISSIKGRIIHPQYGDVLVLVEENQQYYLVKQNQKHYMTE